MEGLLDFGSGGLSGAGAGASIASGLKLSNPWGIGLTAGMGLLGGAISLFGGGSQRRLERKVNRQQLALGDQQLELGSLQLSQVKRADKQQRQAEMRKRQFGQMLGDYFRNQAGR